MFNLVLSALLVIPMVLFGKSVSNSDSLRMQLRENHPDSVKVDILIRLSELRTVRPDSAHAYVIKALNISKHISYNSGIGRSYGSLIAFAETENEIDSLMELSIQFFARSKKTQYEALVFLKAASRYLTFGEGYSKAFHYANLFLANHNNDQDFESYARGWNIIGEVYRISKNYDRAMDAYRQSRRYAISNGEIIFLSPFINIGTIHLELGHLDSALTQYDFVQDYLIKTKDEQSNTFAYIKYRRAQVLLSMGSMTNALSSGKTGFKLYQRLDHNEGMVLTLGIISEVYFRQGLFRKAIHYGKQAVELAGRINYVINDVDQICEVVANSYYQLSDFKNAYLYRSIQNDLMSKLFNPSVTASLINELLTLEGEKQEAQNELFEIQRRKDESVIKIQKTLNYFSISGVLVLLGVSFLFYYNAKAKQQLNFQLHEKNEEILAQTEELTAQGEELRAANEKVEATNANLSVLVNKRTQVIEDQNYRLREYSYFNAHKVRGPLARILGLIAIIEYEYSGDFFPYMEMLKTASNELDNAIKDINVILEAE